MTARREGSKWIFLLKITCFSFDRARAMRLLRSSTGLLAENQPSCFHNAVDPLWLGRGAAIRLRINCIGPAHPPSIQCQIGVPIKLGPTPQQLHNLPWS